MLQSVDRNWKEGSKESISYVMSDWLDTIDTTISASSRRKVIEPAKDGSGEQNWVRGEYLSPNVGKPGVRLMRWRMKQLSTDLLPLLRIYILRKRSIVRSYTSIFCSRGLQRRELYFDFGFFRLTCTNDWDNWKIGTLKNSVPPNFAQPYAWAWAGTTFFSNISPQRIKITAHSG